MILESIAYVLLISKKNRGACKPTKGVILRKLLVLTVLILACLPGNIGTKSAQARPSYHYRWDNMVRNCEARGVPNPWYAHTGNGFYFGPQFTYGTWRAEGGPRLVEVEGRGVRMKSVPIWKIIQVAERTAAAQGISHAWPNCYPYL